MAKVEVRDIRPETPAEAAQREWFAQQALAAPDNLESAARLLTGLVTTLLGMLFGVLAITGDPLPGYLAMPVVRGLGVTTVGLLLLSLLSALIVVLPFRAQVASGKPSTQEQAFARLLKRKSHALTVAVVSFGLGLLALGSVLILALLTAT